MNNRNEGPYLLVVGAPDQESPGCLQAVTSRFRYDEASSAADAIELAGRHRPSLIVLNLDGADGSPLDVCRELVAAESTRDIPILAIAGPPEQQFMIALAIMPCDSNALDREIHRIIGRDTVH